MLQLISVVTIHSVQLADIATKVSSYVIAATKSDTVPNTKDVEAAEYGKVFEPGCDVSAYLLHDWATDPFCKGLWSSYRGLGMSMHLTALQKPHGAIFFASADWADGWRGFIDGALESGKRAARDASRLLDVPTRSSKI
jgi:lysyl oxidase-like protein 2/3/4